MVRTLKVNGIRGEITPLMHARFDTEFFQAGYAQARNTVITRYGPHTRVPGTLVQGRTKFADKMSKQIPFEFTEEQIYSLEFGDGYVRFWTPEGRVVSGGSPYEIVSPYDEADLPYVHVRQSGDAIYIFCRGKRPYVLKRLAETNWVFEPYKPKNGPFQQVNDTATTLTLGGTGNAVPLMTANNAPAPVVVSTYQMHNRVKAQKIQVSATNSGAMQVDFGAGNAKVVDSYFLIASNDNHYTDTMFSQWDFQGSNNGSSWVNIDSRDGENGWAGSEFRYFQTANKNAYRYYRIAFSAGGNNVAPNTYAGGWYLHQAADDQTPVTLTASSTIGINDGAGFDPLDAGRTVRVQGSDGRWRWLEIKSYVSPTQVTVVINGDALLDMAPMQAWALGAWGDSVGWPRTGRFFEDRLALASWPRDPIGMALSVNSAYDDFRTSSPLVDDDGLSIRMTGGRLDVIHWLAETGTLLAGTAGGLRSIGSRDSAEVLKFDNIKQKLETSTAASYVQPVMVENVGLFMDRMQRRLYEVGFTYEVDGYLAREVSVLNDHLFKPGVEQIDFVEAPHKIIIGRRRDGKLVFFSYDREQKIAGGTLIDLGGVIEDVMVMPGRDYEDVWLTVRRVRDGAPVRFVEKLALFWDGDIDPDAMPVYSACSYAYDDAPTAGLAGLDALAGVTVGVWADGQDIGNADVNEDGEVVLPYGKVASRIVVGERLPWRIQTLRPASVGQEPALGKEIRIAKATLDVFETARIYAGSLQEQELVRSEDYTEHDPDLPEPILTAMLPIPVDDSWRNEGVFVITGDSMYPATIRAIVLEVESDP